MAAGLFHNPVVLYHASTKCKEAAWAAYKRGDWVLAMYLAGLAVEAILQAIALNDDPTHDARHDLPKWLARCRTSLQEALKSEGVRECWNRVCRVWRSELRYLSRDGLLGYLRARELNRGITGGPDDIMKVNTERLLSSAVAGHNRGVAAWARYNRKS
jgi:HEPN domain-containing protein